MTHEDHFRRLENMFASAPIHKLIQTRINITEGRAEVTLPVVEKLFHAAGAVHGAIYFMALDNAAFFAANSLVRDAFVLTSNFNIYLLRPIAQGAISAVGTVVARSRSQIVAEAVACNAKGREIARGSGVFVPGKTALSPETGYC